MTVCPIAGNFNFAVSPKVEVWPHDNEEGAFALASPAVEEPETDMTVQAQDDVSEETEREITDDDIIPEFKLANNYASVKQVTFIGKTEKSFLLGKRRFIEARFEAHKTRRSYKRGRMASGNGIALDDSLSDLELDFTESSEEEESALLVSLPPPPLLLTRANAVVYMDVKNQCLYI